MSAIAEKPAHVPADLVVDFDYRDFPGHDTDVHLAWSRLHTGPDLVWSNRLGGYWIATRADDIELMQTDHERFSYRHVTIPPLPGMVPLAPLEYDPPAHGRLRAILSPAFGPGPIQRLEGDLRRLTRELLEQIAPRGHCEFVDAFAKRLPVTAFLRLVDLPLSDRAHLLALTEMSVRPHSEDDRRRAYAGLQEYTGKWVAQRRANPGADLFSRIVNARIDGQPLTDEQTSGMLTNVLFGGLDTVSSMLSFTARCLAERADLRGQLAADPGLADNAIEELLRRFGVPNTARVVTHDFEYKGLPFKTGEQILLSKALHGLDERRFPDPLRLDFQRKRQPHAAFGDGPHRCPGSFLARLEMRVFLEEWLARIPHFRIPAGARVRTSSGPVNGVLELPLEWSPEP